MVLAPAIEDQEAALRERAQEVVFVVRHPSDGSHHALVHLSLRNRRHAG